ncbi:unnamed protein product [Vitrella brassicaformis CCMP3155]|uniref:Uncharacterized protein n=1 Tax=Vitrella brassicaformis (strain CCMP3155) TaxID=1169540 RepID=A0A0G4H0M1_VITBC|nr:unnamed protein product [Vitrella brassicaformis CCMP3155]|eukprot:CEM37106.1 unnamed protein product [Vitrella brassicaformis CCMP3155]
MSEPSVSAADVQAAAAAARESIAVEREPPALLQAESVCDLIGALESEVDILRQAVESLAKQSPVTHLLPDSPLARFRSSEVTDVVLEVLQEHGFASRKLEFKAEQGGYGDSMDDKQAARQCRDVWDKTKDVAAAMKRSWLDVYDRAGRYVLFGGVIRRLGQDVFAEVDQDILLALLPRLLIHQNSDLSLPHKRPHTASSSSAQSSLSSTHAPTAGATPARPQQQQARRDRDRDFCDNCRYGYDRAYPHGHRTGRCPDPWKLKCFICKRAERADCIHRYDLCPLRPRPSSQSPPPPPSASSAGK